MRLLTSQLIATDAVTQSGSQASFNDSACVRCRKNQVNYLLNIKFYYFFITMHLCASKCVIYDALKVGRFFFFFFGFFFMAGAAGAAAAAGVSFAFGAGGF